MKVYTRDTFCRCSLGTNAFEAESHRQNLSVLRDANALLVFDVFAKI